MSSPGISMSSGGAGSGMTLDTLHEEIQTCAHHLLDRLPHDSDGNADKWRIREIVETYQRNPVLRLEAELLIYPNYIEGGEVAQRQ